MKKYKQTLIPCVRTDGFDNSTFAIREYYKSHLQGKCVINQHLKIPIHFTSLGKGKLAFGSGRYVKRSVLVRCLEKLVAVAEFNNFGGRKITDKSSVLGYLNFKAKVKIDGKTENIRITVMLKRDGKVYYNHEVNMIK